MTHAWRGQHTYFLLVVYHSLMALGEQNSTSTLYLGAIPDSKITNQIKHTHAKNMALIVKRTRVIV